MNFWSGGVDRVGAGLIFATCIGVALGAAVDFWFFAIFPAFPAGIGFAPFDGGGGGALAGVSIGKACSTRTS